MRKITGGLIAAVFLLSAVAAQAADSVDVFGISSDTIQMTIVTCSSNSDCASGAECLSAGVCVDDITSAPTGQTCTINEDCAVGSSCEQMSICVDGFGCINDEDCAEDEFCLEATGECRPIVECDLRIKPPTIKISGKKKPTVVRLLRIRGNENFNPDAASVFEEVDLGPMSYGKTLIRKKLLKLQTIVPTDAELGIYEIRIGNCFGEVELQ